VFASDFADRQPTRLVTRPSWNLDQRDAQLKILRDGRDRTAKIPRISSWKA
jgi:hypothetical protein